MKIAKNHPFIFLIVAVAFYVVGAAFLKTTNIERLTESGIAQQNEYTYTDSGGEEHEEVSYIKSAGIGKILTYNDVYYASVAMFIIAMVIGGILWGDGLNTKSDESLRHIVFANCILGVLLIWLSSKETIWATVFFWLGVVMAYIVVRSMKSV